MGKNVSFSVRWDNDGYHHLNYLELFEKYLQKVKHSTGDNYTALCPFHDDHNPSFSFDATSGLWQCFACGEKGNAWQFADRMGDEEWKQKITRAKKKEQGKIVENWKKDAIKQAPKVEQAQKEKKVIRETTYIYHDKQGAPIYKKTRYDFDDGSKTFNIDWIAQEKKLLLYDLACLQYIEPSDVSEIWFCEGEKCREALLEATDGRSDILIFSYSVSPGQEIENSAIKDYLHDKKIVVFVDNDETGERKASQIIAYTKKYAHQIDVVRFVDKEKGYDIADFLGEGHHIEEALLLADTVYIDTSIIIHNLDEYAHIKIDPVPILDPLHQIPVGILSVVAGMGSVGKGFFMLWNMLRWVKMYSVAYLSTEDPPHIIQLRLQKLVNKRQKRIVDGKEYIVPIGQKKSLKINPLRNLSLWTLSSLYDTILFHVEQGYEIIVVDPISAFLENELDNTAVAKFMHQVQALCQEANVNIFLSHHIRKRQKGEQIRDQFDMMDQIRGASALHSNARYVWFLRRNAKNSNILEVWNVKNSYVANNSHFAYENLIADGVVKMGTMTLQNGETIISTMREFYDFEMNPWTERPGGPRHNNMN